MAARLGQAAPNLDRASSLMRECVIDAIVACSPINVRYLTGFANWLGPSLREYMVRPGGSDDPVQRAFVVLPVGAEPVLVVEPSFVLDAADTMLSDIRVAGGGTFAAGDEGRPSGAVAEHDLARELLAERAWPADPVTALAAILEEHGLARSRLGLEKGALLPHELERLAAAVPGATLLDCQALLRLVRTVKTEREIEILARATTIAEEAAMYAAENADERSTTAELVDGFRAFVAKEGADLDHVALSLDGLGFVTGGDRPLRGGTSMFFDYGCVYHGWISDAGTTLCIGDPTPAALAEYAAVRGAVVAGAEALRPQARGSEVQRAMQESLLEAGIVESFPHGHGIGLEVREYPILVSAEGRTIRDECIEVDADLALEQGMVLNLESSVLVLGERSVHCEQSFVVTSGHCRPLTVQYRDAPLVAGERRQTETFA